MIRVFFFFFFFSSRRRHTRLQGDWSSDVCSSDLKEYMPAGVAGRTDRTKVMPLSDTAREEYEWGLERFLEEARVLKKSNHPNIVTVDTVFRDNGTAYLVME